MSVFFFRLLFLLPVSLIPVDALLAMESMPKTARVQVVGKPEVDKLDACVFRVRLHALKVDLELYKINNFNQGPQNHDQKNHLMGELAALINEALSVPVFYHDELRILFSYVQDAKLLDLLVEISSEMNPRLSWGSLETLLLAAFTPVAT